ncbi:MAG: hypothetical protein ABIR03_05965 [Ginsengibacter sp.]
MNKFLDLRFVIGIFFLVVGVLLLLHSLFTVPEAGFSKTVNLWCSIFFIAFSVIMLLLSKDRKPKDKL